MSDPTGGRILLALVGGAVLDAVVRPIGEQRAVRGIRPLPERCLTTERVAEVFEAFTD